MYCKSCGAAVVGKYCSCCGTRLERRPDAQQSYMDIEKFGKVIDMMCRYSISAEMLAKQMGVTKKKVFLIIGHGAFSEDAVQLCAAIGELVVPLAMKRNAEVNARLRQLRADRSTKN